MNYPLDSHNIEILKIKIRDKGYRRVSDESKISINTLQAAIRKNPIRYETRNKILNYISPKPIT